MYNVISTKTQFYTLAMILEFIGYNFPQELLKIIYSFFITSKCYNDGFMISDELNEFWNEEQDENSV